MHYHIPFCGVTQALLKLSKTSCKIVTAENLVKMSKKIRKNVAIPTTASVRTTNPIAMVMSDPAIRILVAMCLLGRNSVPPADAEHSDTTLSAEHNSATNVTDDTDGVLASSCASASVAHVSDAADEQVAYTSDSCIKAAQLAARALATIAEDDWCRVRLVQVTKVVAIIQPGHAS